VKKTLAHVWDFAELGPYWRYYVASATTPPVGRRPARGYTNQESDSTCAYSLR